MVVVSSESFPHSLIFARQPGRLPALIQRARPVMEHAGLLSGGWENVYRHCVYAGAAMYVLARGVGLDVVEQETAACAGLLHDYDQKMKRDEARNGPDVQMGQSTITPTDWKALASIESREPHLPPGWETCRDAIRVTGCLWPDRAPDGWSWVEKMMRWVDSVTANQLTDHGFIPYTVRISEMAKVKRGLDEAGYPIYGMSTFTKLHEITRRIDRELFAELFRRGHIPTTEYTEEAVLKYVSQQTGPLMKEMLG